MSGGSLPEIHLVRHGKTAWSLTGRATGRTNIPLTNRGVLNAQNPGHYCRPRASSSFSPPIAERTAVLAGFDDCVQPDPEAFDLGGIVEVWRRGSVIPSWLLDLTAASLVKDPTLGAFGGSVLDSEEGRWTIKAAINENVQTQVLSTELYARFSSRGEAEFADRLMSSMRFEFGGYVEKSTDV